MGYQSKTYSLSDEVVAAIEAARAAGETPNQLLQRVLVQTDEWRTFFDSEMIRHQKDSEKFGRASGRKPLLKPKERK